MTNLGSSHAESVANSASFWLTAKRLSGPAKGVSPFPLYNHTPSAIDRGDARRLYWFFALNAFFRLARLACPRAGDSNRNEAYRPFEARGTQQAVPLEQNTVGNSKTQAKALDQ
jgi:hypothetical protein